MYLAAITHCLKTNTLEAVWLKDVLDSNGEIIGSSSVKCHNYSPSQKELFLAEVENGEKWTTAAGWTDEYCEKFKLDELNTSSSR